MTTNIPLKRNVPMLTEVKKKECEDQAANSLPKNLDEAVEKNVAKKSADEAQSKPN